MTKQKHAEPMGVQRSRKCVDNNNFHPTERNTMFIHIVIAITFLTIGLLIGANNTNKVKKAANAARTATEAEVDRLRSLKK